jgi:hypothetical protein
MVRACCLLFWGALLVGFHLAAAVRADDEPSSAPVPAQVSPAAPKPPPTPLPGPIKATQSDQPAADAGTMPLNSLPSPFQGQVGSSKPADQAPESSLGAGIPSALGPDDRSPGLGQIPRSPSGVPGSPQPGLMGQGTLLDRTPSELSLGYRPPSLGELASSPGSGGSSILPGQRGWSTLLEGKSIDPAPGQSSAPAGSNLGRSETITRFGWWGGGVNGSPLKVGEYQGLGTSPFWDIDTIRSNGRGTVDLWGSQLNSESWDLRSHFYQNGFSGDVNFEQFPHLLENSPLAGGSRQSNSPVVIDNLNVGEDSAIRVQQLKLAFKGPLTKNIQWKIQFWMFRKYGERQVNSMAHCFNINLVGGQPDNHCHVLSQLQHIDWLTLEVEPGLVAKFNRVTVDYTRTMRYFTPNDQTVYAPFNNFPSFGSGTSLTIFPYALVPESMFQMDRLKLGVDLTDTLRIYSYLYNGDMLNLTRNVNNQFGGFDLRLIKTTPSGVTATAYAKMNENRSQMPSTLLPEEQGDPSAIRHPVNYTRWWTGLDGQWFPFRDASTVWQGLSFRANYEYHEVNYQYANYPTDVPASYVVPPTVTNAVVTGPYFNQPTTRSNQVVFAQRMRWTSGVNTFARYQFTTIENPLYGMTPLSGAINTNLPTFEQIFEIGGSWAPLPNLLLSARAEIQSMWQKSSYANGVESNYPVLFTAWYAPTPRWSISAGYSYFSNWVNQDVTLGYRGQDEPPPAETLRMGFKGQTQVVNFGGRYAWSEKLILTAGLFFTDGLNVFNVPASQTGANWSTMPVYSNVLAQSVRYQGGFDYKLSEKISGYFRVNVFDYQDKSQEIGTGTAFFFLGGLSGTF